MKTNKGRAIVAMSGGVDSSTVAALLHDEGYEVVGITLQLYDHGQAVNKAKSCCAGQDIHDAAQAAEHIGIRHYVLDYESKFRQSVIDDFADSYLRGETPVPCIRCNQTVKFSDLLTTAQDLGGEFLATGHYVQRLNGAVAPAELHQGADPVKDQSYFLFATTQTQLDYLRFPLGHKTKQETRQLAAHYGLKIADKPDSQDICFVPTGKYSELVKKLRPEGIQPGDIVHINGEKLGTHNGIIHYTVGQRRGLDIAWHEPLYVVALKPEEQQVIVGSQADLAVHQIHIKDVNWLGQQLLTDTPQHIAAKIRSTRPATPATVQHGPHGALVTFDTPQFGVSPGQACVFYDNTRMLGGGWIC